MQLTRFTQVAKATIFNNPFAVECVYKGTEVLREGNRIDLQIESFTIRVVNIKNSSVVGMAWNAGNMFGKWTEFTSCCYIDTNN